jgi:drug/metabolite transporter (DMT)-like permease
VVYFYLILQQLIGSLTHIIAQDATHAVAPNTLLLLRCSGASLVFFVILFITEKRWNIFARIERQDYGRLLIIGILNVPMNQLLYLHGIKFTTPANSALLYAMTPAFVFILTSILHSERPSKMKALGITLALIGAAIIMFEHGAALHEGYTLGNILIFIAVIAWSLFTMMGRPLVLKYGALYVTGLNMIIGSLLYLPIGLLSTDSGDISSMTSGMWLQVAYLALIASVINYILWYAALGKLEATRVAVFQNLQPVMTTAMALYLGRVTLTGEFLGGGVLALAGILIVELG